MPTFYRPPRIIRTFFARPRRYWFSRSPLQTFAGTAAGTSTCTAVGVAIKAAVGSTAGTASVTAVGRGIHKVAGTAAGTSTVSATARAVRALVGVAAGSSSVGAVLVLGGQAAGGGGFSGGTFSRGRWRKIRDDYEAEQAAKAAAAVKAERDRKEAIRKAREDAIAARIAELAAWQAQAQQNAELAAYRNALNAITGAQLTAKAMQDAEAMRSAVQMMMQEQHRLAMQDEHDALNALLAA